MNRPPASSASPCRTHDPELWFPEKGSSGAAALRLCGGCPVRERCLEYALKHKIRDGIWGGMTGGQRRELIVGRPARTRALVPEHCTYPGCTKPYRSGGFCRTHYDRAMRKAG